MKKYIILITLLSINIQANPLWFVAGMMTQDNKKIHTNTSNVFIVVESDPSKCHSFSSNTRFAIPISNINYIEEYDDHCTKINLHSGGYVKVSYGFSDFIDKFLEKIKELEK